MVLGGLVFGFGVGVRMLLGEEKGNSSKSRSEDIGGVCGSERYSLGGICGSRSFVDIWLKCGEEATGTSDGGGDDEIVIGSVVVPVVDASLRLEAFDMGGRGGGEDHGGNGSSSAILSFRAAFDALENASCAPVPNCESPDAMLSRDRAWLFAMVNGLIVLSTLGEDNSAGGFFVLVEGFGPGLELFDVNFRLGCGLRGIEVRDDDGSVQPGDEALLLDCSGWTPGLIRLAYRNISPCFIPDSKGFFFFALAAALSAFLVFASLSANSFRSCSSLQVATASEAPISATVSKIQIFSGRKGSYSFGCGLLLVGG